eukprot:CAMPEP_0194439920 /NCGR_PEP_ID=MMETSP0176-20130528/113059_1 /TAXON_ID=216777 /ORGANISM="Proboscia alata, Strain PI-D3" /LENGTH=197 /DNA_ID=CAMNT_0039263629 /DNA_START=152 /DNA_END=741 /DNA_ORIENTATION=-
MSLRMVEQRRGFLARAVPAAVGIHAASFASVSSPANPLRNTNSIANAADLVFYSSSSGKQYQYADKKIGTGDPKAVGDPVVIDYIMSTSGASNGVKIYSTTDSGVPYQWVLGDASTIAGLERAVAGGDGVPPMLPGGIRRVIIAGNSSSTTTTGATTETTKLGYDAGECAEGRGKGPVPRGETYNRFKNVFCNLTRP